MKGAMDDHPDPLVVQMTGSLLRSKEGKMVVTFSDQFAAVLEDVRRLQALGFAVPADIQTHAAKVHKFQKQALTAEPPP